MVDKEGYDDRSNNRIFVLAKRVQLNCRRSEGTLSFNGIL